MTAQECFEWLGIQKRSRAHLMMTQHSQRELSRQIEGLFQQLLTKTQKKGQMVSNVAHHLQQEKDYQMEERFQLLM
jgi:hypothetical protein